MARYWQLPAPPKGIGLRDFLAKPELSVEEFHDVVAHLGLTRRLLPPRTTKPQARENKPAIKQAHGVRKPWHVEPQDRD
jgi:hypothetical protein